MQTTATLPRAGAERAPNTEELDHSLVRGLAWTGALKWTAQLLAWVSTLVVIRLLKPEDYGLIGMATLYLGLIQLLSEFGVGTAVIMLRNLTRAQIAQLNSTAVGLGVAGFAAACVAAAPLGHFFNAPRLPPVVIAVSVGFIITAFGVIPQSLLQKEMNFKRVSLYGAAQVIAASVCTVVLALLGFGYWALVVGNLLGALVFTGLLVAQRSQPYALPDPYSLRHAFMLSGNVLLSRLAWYTYSNADFLVVGKFLGQAALGTYTIAWSLATLVVDKISAVVGEVTPSLFSATQRDVAMMRRYLLNVTEALALVTFPAAVGLALVADEFVHVALGDTWVAAIVPLRLLACYGLVRSLTPFLPQVLTALGDSAFPMKVSVAAALVLPIGFYAGSRYGTTGVALVWLAAYPAIALALYWRVFNRIDMTPRSYLRALWPALSATAAMTIALITLDALLPAAYPMRERFALKVCAGAAAYAGTVLVFHRDRVSALRTLVGAARNGVKPPVNDKVEPVLVHA